MDHGPKGADQTLLHACSCICKLSRSLAVINIRRVAGIVAAGSAIAAVAVAEVAVVVLTLNLRPHLIRNLVRGPLRTA